MIKAVIFDCFGVLTTDLWRAYIDSLPPHIDVDQARELNKAYGAGLLTIDEFQQQLYEVTGSLPAQVENQLDNDINKNTLLLAFIRELRKNYKIGLLSNIATNWIRESFLTGEEQSLFDAMVFSYEVGMTKPDMRIYQLACDRLGVEPGEALFIDDIDSYCKSAQKLGIRTVTYDSYQQSKAEIEAVLSQD